MRASLMDLFRYLLVAVALSLALPNAAWAQGNPPDMMDRGSARLVAERAIAPGASGDLALVFLPNEGWHGYWRNPGDAGQGMVLEWQLPAGWSVGETQYPVPQTYVIQGIMNHIFEGEHAVLVPLAVPDGTAPGAYRVTVFARWLTCSESLCVPQQATLSTAISVGEGVEVHPRFDSWRAAIAPLLDRKASLQFTAEALRLSIPLPAAMEIASPHVFIAQEQLVDYNAPQRFYRDGDALIVEIPRGGLRHEAQAVSGIIALGGARDGLRFEAEPGEVSTGGEALDGTEQPTSLAWLILAALAGGLILNLMPCVFPILSLKAMTLARAGESAAGARREALAYSAGVVLACLALGGLLLALRAGGEQIGWAFQLQEPGVVVALLVLAVLITANFAGLFELPSLSVTRTGGPGSSFATGLLAAFVATPCTGPFMAAALGAALLLPTAQALLLFAALGLGLALPFLLLGFVPALRNRLPRPGPWMDRFRKAMAIPMGLTALALIWLATRLGGQGFALVALVMTVGLVIALMVTGRLQRAGKLAWPAFGLIAAPFALFGAFALPASFTPATAGQAESIHSPINYSEAALAEARASGQPVFLWFTADWCLTCKVNEGVAIERDEVRDAFEAAGVVTMRGDWTVRDEAITRFLTEQGAAGVPLYLWYPVNGPPQQLPQLLTPDMLVELAEAG
ncbi:protein-disulfide reductase DsbD family protein [Alteraurantiacibacter aestuarii]|nr:thioredoxin family protein [Alteraurantiacibacter aestuarii]